MTKKFTREMEGDINLLLLASILEDADERHRKAGEPVYDQTRWEHECGTPACAIGHWRKHQGKCPIPSADGALPGHRREFGLTHTEWRYLFGFEGDYAKTAAEAAERIRAFVTARTAART